jgi:hypothetical protein
MSDFREGELVEWIDPPAEDRIVKLVASLIEEFGLGPFMVVGVRAAMPQRGGQVLRLANLVGEKTIAASCWYKRSVGSRANVIFPKESVVQYSTRYGETKRNGQNATVLEHAPQQGGGTAHLVLFEDGHMKWVYALELKKN